ncbi:MAG TPA: hypothetical protein VHC69_05830 [Polyangiaceae bacterium]|nr:hypothetical protein [Polyangiaceae bacterium]
MSRDSPRHRHPISPFVLVALVVGACTQRPEFRCKQSDQCLLADGSRGACVQGACVFHGERSVVTPPDSGGGLRVDAGCGAGSAGQCYRCTPTTPAQIVNACTTSTCVPFDDATRLAHLLPDGGLPPLPAAPQK